MMAPAYRPLSYSDFSNRISMAKTCHSAAVSNDFGKGHLGHCDPITVISTVDTQYPGAMPNDTGMFASSTSDAAAVGLPET